MKKRLTILLIFSTTVLVSMVFALPLSNNGRLIFSVSQADTISNQFPIYNDASTVYVISEPSDGNTRGTNFHTDEGDTKITSSQIDKGKNPGLNSQSATAAMLLIGTGLIGLVGIGRNKG